VVPESRVRLGPADPGSHRRRTGACRRRRLPVPHRPRRPPRGRPHPYEPGPARL